MLTERDLCILEYLYRYYCLSRAQLGRLCFPNDSGGRVTRRRLQMLVDAGLIRRMPILLTNPLASSNASQGSVYYPALRGLEVLAEHRGDQRVLAGTTRTPQMHRLSHWLAVSETHVALDAAIASQSLVTCPCFYNEWDTVNAEETLPEKRFRLYLLLEQKPRLVCAPDAAFLLEVGTLRKAFYLEQDLATSSVPQVAASKTKGYAVMAERGLHRKHFPEENIGAFSVLLVTRSRHRREALKSAFRGKPGATLWRFAAEEDLTPEKVLFEPIFHPCEGDPVPLIKTPPMPQAADAADVAAENSETQENA